ncbi:MAG TPA: hypothetical protein VLC46_19800 [Thermoanaerobaculia bacterium]|jgi:hypothetical protein|nr:hypothetical protein [Thermoanaerobaculia bacterium]
MTPLRLWSLGEYPQFIALVDSLPPQPIALTVTKIPGTEMWFGSIDVTALVTNANLSPTSVTVYPSGYGSSSAPLPFPPI